MTYKPFGGQTYSLGASIGSSDTSILLSSFKEPVSNVAYTMALLATDIVYGTIAPGTSSSEFISFTTITQNADGSCTLGGVTRGLAKKSPFTTSATFKLPHSGQSVFIISNPPQLYEKFVSKENTETITGVKTFSSSPVVPTGGTGTMAANATDIANAVTGASGTATNSVAGTTKLSVAAVSAPNPIAVGDNDNRVSPVSLATVTANIVAALAGTGTPNGTTGKYVTNDDVTSAKTANKVARRDANGDVLVSTTPTSGDSASSKTYVNQQVDATRFISSSTDATTAIPAGATWAMVQASMGTSGPNVGGATFCMVVSAELTPTTCTDGKSSGVDLSITCTWNPGGNLVVSASGGSNPALGSVKVAFYK